MNNSKVLLGLLVIGLGATLMWQTSELRKSKLESETLRQTLAGKEQADQTAEAPAPLVDLEELDRLRRDQRELLKLRGETTVLRRQLQQAQAAVARAQLETNSSAALPALPVQQPRTFTATRSTVVTSGAALIAGGWATEPGKRTFVLVSPSIEKSQDGQNQVSVKNRFFTVPEDVANDLGLTRMLNDEAPPLTVDWMQFLLNELETREGVDVLAAPRVITGDGLQAEVAVHDVRDNVAYGPSVNITPTVLENSKVQMIIAARLTLPAENAP